MAGKVNGRVAIITGGTTGLGAATTRLFASNGYRVLATALSDPDQLIPLMVSQGYDVHFLRSDLSTPKESSNAIVDQAILLFGQIDVVVNCAAMISHKEVSQVAESDWDEIFAVNLKAPFFMAQAALPYLTITKGCIINISSTNAWRVNLKNHLYDSLKAALNHLTKGLALEFREKGVRVNALMPGAMHTPLVRAWLDEYLDRPRTDADLASPSVVAPEIVAQGVLALASEELRWVNGAEIPMDGGYRLG
ncbi:MAG: SDR family oxidoreductase [Actinobacteria bacterium]|nr:SDR family oxidoreductase [Actinomycetota bacterium]